MNKFLEELKDVVGQCQVMSWSNGEPCSLVNEDEVNEAVELIDSLGEHAKRMLEIGIVQDDLVKLGFVPVNMNRFSFIHYDSRPNIYITFADKIIGIELYYKNDVFIEYTLPTWQDDLLSKVKELINE
jgi:hypothetical protein